MGGDLAPSASIAFTDAQFDAMSWHDNYVHAVRVVEGQHGSGELILDIDYIAECLHEAGGFRFRHVPSLLRFKDVTSLRVALDYAGMSAALVPFSIDAIQREKVQRERYEAQVWTIALNFPDGETSFEATGYEQQA